ncbi:MAG: PLP-dependent lyase/thiolase [Deltaproteobacteria bacterium]|nr:PLP-dependent lyase/thiolase [Deltaproteobacteria bacterium]
MLELICQGCGRTVPLAAPTPWRCPGAGDGRDHVLAAPPYANAAVGPETNPFLRYRQSMSAWHLARQQGLSDADYCQLVQDLDDHVRAVDGVGFVQTPFGRSQALQDAAAAPGPVFVKVETAAPGGSHKARHLMGLALFAQVQQRAGLLSGEQPRLAIASCGNAALAAAVIARAWQRPLDVFIPPDANPRVVARLQALGAQVEICHRQPGVAGDPCYHAFLQAVAQGALPFCCQGSDIGLTIEGGKTLAWELAELLAGAGVRGGRLFVQVGGGALASSVWQGLAEVLPTGARPRLHPVQTHGAYPLRRAWLAVAAEVARELGDATLTQQAQALTSTGEPAQDDRFARGLHAQLATPAGQAALQRALATATQERSRFMWPWEEAPHSVAHGILDDETYDWLALVRGTLESGGFPVIASEELLVRAHAQGRAAGYQADPTGTSGLAGLLVLAQAGLLAATEPAVVLFTGVER